MNKMSETEIIKYVSENQGRITTKELMSKFNIDRNYMLRLMIERKICWFPVEGKLYVWLHYKDYSEAKRAIQ